MMSTHVQVLVVYTGSACTCGLSQFHCGYTLKWEGTTDQLVQMATLSPQYIPATVHQSYNHYPQDKHTQMENVLLPVYTTGLQTLLKEVHMSDIHCMVSKVMIQALSRYMYTTPNAVNTSYMQSVLYPIV
jgi:hypothetical protein